MATKTHFSHSNVMFSTPASAAWRRLLLSPWIPVSNVIEEQRQRRKSRRRVSQIREAGSSALRPPSSSRMEMPSQGPFMNPGLTPTFRPGRELPGIFCKQTSTWKWQNVWNPAAIFPLCSMRGDDPPPHPSSLCPDCPNLTFYPLT